MRQLLDNRVISPNFVRSKVNLTDQLTKPLERKLVYKKSRRMRLILVTKINNDDNSTYEIEKSNK